MKYIIILFLSAACFTSCSKCYDCTGTGLNGAEYSAKFCNGSPEYDYIKTHSNTFTNNQVTSANCK